MKNRTSVKTLASSHISLAIALFGFSLLTTGISATTYFVLALFFTLSSIIIIASTRKSMPKWLTNFIWGLHISYLSFFLGISALGIGVMTKGCVILGGIVVVIGFFLLGMGIGANIVKLMKKKAQ